MCWHGRGRAVEMCIDVRHVLSYTSQVLHPKHTKEVRDTLAQPWVHGDAFKVYDPLCLTHCFPFHLQVLHPKRAKELRDTLAQTQSRAEMMHLDCEIHSILILYIRLRNTPYPYPVYSVSNSAAASKAREGAAGHAGAAAVARGAGVCAHAAQGAAGRCRAGL